MANNTNTIEEMAGIYTAKHDKKPELALHAIDIIRLISSKSDVDENELWNLIDSTDIGERTSKANKLVKSRKKRDAKFKPDKSILPSVPTIRNLFIKDFKTECKDEGREYSHEYCDLAYKALKETEIEKLRERREAIKKAYDIEKEKLRLRAIYYGEFTPQRIKKRSNSAYMYFANSCHDFDTTFVSKANIGKIKKMTSMTDRVPFIKKLWDALTDTKRNEVIAKYDEFNRIHSFRLYEREVIILNGKIRYYQNINDTIMVSKVQAELENLKEAEPEGYEDYKSSSDYTPVYDLSEFEN